MTLGAAFTTAADGDVRSDAGAREQASRAIGVSAEWSTVRQVHGDRVVVVDAPGDAGEADALLTTKPGLPLAVFTADCVGVVIEGDRAVGVAHAGWRGARAGVVRRLLDAFGATGVEPRIATIGPHIRSCCFEVGPEVAAEFDGHRAETTWGTPSVDLAGHVRASLEGIEVADLGVCTMCGDDTFSHRRDGDRSRMAALGWLAGERT